MEEKSMPSGHYFPLTLSNINRRLMECPLK